MTVIITFKFIHYLAIVFSGGVLVGGGVIQSVYAKANQIPDLTTAKIFEVTWLYWSYISNCFVGIWNYTIN